MDVIEGLWTDDVISLSGYQAPGKAANNSQKHVWEHHTQTCNAVCMLREELQFLGRANHVAWLILFAQAKC